MYLAGTAGLLDINGTLIADLIAFLILLAILARWVYPAIVRQAEARQRQIAADLEAAEKARAEAEERLKQAEQRLAATRQQAEQMLASANRSAEQTRQELKDKGQEEARRIVEQARREIETARQQALDSVRSAVADLVVLATEKVVGEALDGDRHRRLIEEAVEEISSGKRGG